MYLKLIKIKTSNHQWHKYINFTLETLNCFTCWRTTYLVKKNLDSNCLKTKAYNALEIIATLRKTGLMKAWWRLDDLNFSLAKSQITLAFNSDNTDTTLSPKDAPCIKCRLSGKVTCLVRQKVWKVLTPHSTVFFR